MSKHQSLVLENLTKKFGSTVAVDDISLEVYDNEFLTLLGPSGCGKTTLLSMIAGFVMPDKGNIYIGGELVTKKPPNERKIGMVFQNYALFPHMNVHENVAFGLKIRKLPQTTIDQKVLEALKLIRLVGFERRYPRELSGGQQQRVALARAIVTEPEVLLLDEPLSNLDYKLRIAMRSELKRIQRNLKKTTIYVTHDQSEALSMSERIVVMKQGRILQVGGPREIYERPGSQDVADFIGDATFLEVTVTGITDTVVIVSTKTGEQLALRPRVQSRDSLKTGDEISVLIRPESPVINRESCKPATENCYQALISDFEYLGSSVRYYVETAKIGTIKVDVRNSADMVYEIGDAVSLILPPDTLQVLA